MHAINCLVATEDTMRGTANVLGSLDSASGPIEIPQGYRMLFLTESTTGRIREIVKEDGKGARVGDSRFLTEGIVRFVQSVCDAAADGAKIAYIETDFFGGEGLQFAALFEKDAPPFIQCASNDDCPVGEYSENQYDWPINTILRGLGVLRESGKDEFDTMGLAAYRKM